MSNFMRRTRHPETGLMEDATWHDDFFGPHIYGVSFPYGRMYCEDEHEWEFEPQVEPQQDRPAREPVRQPERQPVRQRVERQERARERLQPTPACDRDQAVRRVFGLA